MTHARVMRVLGDGVVGLWAPVVVYAAAIFTASSMPRPPLVDTVPDYALHGWAYAGLAFVILRALVCARWNEVTAARVLLTIVLASAYGLSDEIHQRFVPGRVFDLHDLVADTIGAAVVASAMYLAPLVERRIQLARTLRRRLRFGGGAAHGPRRS
jgi:VanZ family protein